MKTNPSRATRPHPMEGRTFGGWPRRFDHNGVRVERLVHEGDVTKINPDWVAAPFEERLVWEAITDFNPKKNRRKK